ncbi:MAG: hypothetical protein VKI82_16205 [Leptolyngbya sp.]|nr:hypothetical protein [Leptolyngbya sp.]
MIQANRLQGLIWQALLKSQSLAVILEPSRTDLVDCIRQISEAGLPLPDVILLDTEINDLNPYEFCRWCRSHFPQIQIFLTRTHRGPIAETERRWAVQQGAAGFLHGFHRETLMSAATASLRLILTTLDTPFLNEKALLSVLLNIRRQMSQATPNPATPNPATPSQTSLAAAKPQGSLPVHSNGTGAMAAGFPPPKTGVFTDISWGSSGLRALDAPKDDDPRGQGHPPRSPHGTSHLHQVDPTQGSSPNDEPSQGIPSSAPEAPSPATPPKTRRYRGVTY